jgi:hypothetical protein
VFKNKQERNKAIDFLVKTEIPYEYNVCKTENSPCWISFSPKTFVKNCLDLHLDGLFFNSFSKMQNYVSKN